MNENSDYISLSLVANGLIMLKLIRARETNRSKNGLGQSLTKRDFILRALRWTLPKLSTGTSSILMKPVIRIPRQTGALSTKLSINNALPPGFRKKKIIYDVLSCAPFHRCTKCRRDEFFFIYPGLTTVQRYIGVKHFSSHSYWIFRRIIVSKSRQQDTNIIPASQLLLYIVTS